MKKVLATAILFAGLLLASSVFAQNGAVPLKKATSKNGYTIVNPGEEILIYKYVHASHSPKEAEKYKPKYFFSIKSSDVLQDLNKENLKKTFPDNHPFHDALDVNFKDDKDLIEYDSFHKMYKLNRIYKNTIK